MCKMSSDIPKFLFPFTTCEKPDANSIVMQPVSSLVNLCTIIILIYFTLQTKTLSILLALLSYIIFEIWHMFSHMQHISGTIQSNIVHILGYFMAFLTLYAIIDLTHQYPTAIFMIALFILIIIDFYVWSYVKGVWTVITGLSILIMVVFGSYAAIPKELLYYFYIFLIGIICLLLVIYNESINCEKMLDIYSFPYHIFVEIIGIFNGNRSIPCRISVWIGKIGCRQLTNIRMSKSYLHRLIFINF